MDIRELGAQHAEQYHQLRRRGLREKIRHKGHVFGMYVAPEQAGFRAFGVAPKAIKLGDRYFDKCHMALDL